MIFTDIARKFMYLSFTFVWLTKEEKFVQFDLDNLERKSYFFLFYTVNLLCLYFINIIPIISRNFILDISNNTKKSTLRMLFENQGPVPLTADIKHKNMWKQCLQDLQKKDDYPRAEIISSLAPSSSESKHFFALNISKCHVKTC